MTPNGSIRRRIRGTEAAGAFAVGLLLATATHAPFASAKGDEIVRAPSGVSYVSGGAGTESIDLLRSMQRDFNVKLVFALDNGQYVAEVAVTIVDASNNVLLEAVSEGPWLMARLPAGAYQIRASYGGRSETRHVAVGSAALRTVDFRWPVG